MASEETEPVLPAEKDMHISPKMYPDITFEETEPVLPIKVAPDVTSTIPSEETSFASLKNQALKSSLVLKYNLTRLKTTLSEIKSKNKTRFDELCM